MRSAARTGEYISYSYDFFNRLVSVQYRSASGQPVTKDVKYAYDINGRRIQKSVDNDGPATGSTAPILTRYVYDGSDVAMELSLADEFSTPTVTHRYLHGRAVDMALADETSTGTRWLLTDYEGSLRDLADSTGKRLNHLRYDAFGKIMAEWDPLVDDLYGYAGGERDEEAGLQQSRRPLTRASRASASARAA